MKLHRRVFVAGERVKRSVPVVQWIRHPSTKREIAGSSPVGDFSMFHRPFDHDMHDSAILGGPLVLGSSYRFDCIGACTKGQDAGNAAARHHAFLIEIYRDVANVESIIMIRARRRSSVREIDAKYQSAYAFDNHSLSVTSVWRVATWATGNADRA